MVITKFWLGAVKEKCSIFEHSLYSFMALDPYHAGYFMYYTPPQIFFPIKLQDFSYWQVITIRL